MTARRVFEGNAVTVVVASEGQEMTLSCELFCRHRWVVLQLSPQVVSTNLGFIASELLKIEDAGGLAEGVEEELTRLLKKVEVWVSEQIRGREASIPAIHQQISALSALSQCLPAVRQLLTQGCAVEV